MASFAIAMVVARDLARSRTFYKDVLGLPLLTDAAPDWVDFDLGGGSRLGLHAQAPHMPTVPGSLQLGFRVDNVDKFVTDARTLGVAVLQEPFDESFGRLAVISDPDGYPVQIMGPHARK